MSVDDEAETRVAVQNALTFAAGGAEQVVIHPISGEAYLLSGEQGRLLAALRGEQTPLQHLAAAGKRLGRPPEALSGLWEALSQKGFALSREDLKGLFEKAAQRGAGATGADGNTRSVLGSSAGNVRPSPPVNGARVTTLAVPTNGPLQALLANVESHVSAARRAGRNMTLLIADSSNEDGEARRRALRTLVSGGVSVRHAGRNERAAFAHRLASRAHVDPAIATFALTGDARFGSDTGANRNVLLLEAAGAPLVMVDDDVRSRFVPAAAVLGDPRDMLTLWSGDPYEARFVAENEPLVRDETWQHKDVLGLHEEWLGRDVASVARHAMNEHHLRVFAGGLFFQRLLWRGGKIRTTQLGCAGDHAMGASTSLLFLGGPSRASLLASEAQFEASYSGRRILRVPRGVAIGDTDFCMTMSCGIDATELVPPFAPCGRNTDGLFGAVMRSCTSDTFAAFLPWAIEHLPHQERRADVAFEHHIAGKRGLNDCVRAIVTTLFDPRGPDTLTHLVQVGALLVSLAAKPEALEHFFREQSLRHIARGLTHIERIRADHGNKPVYWANALTRLENAMRAALTRDDVWLPITLTDGVSTDSAARLLRSYIANVGRLFSAWPTFVAAAIDLRNEGITLMSPV